MKLLLILLSCLLTAAAVHAAEPTSLSAKELAMQLSEKQQDGSSYVRLKMTVKSPALLLQLQIKQRRTAASTEVVYQVLWPKTRAGEAVLLRQSGNQPASGSLFTPPDNLQTLDASQMKNGLFGTDLTYADVVENFFAWDNQNLVGTEVVDRVPCQILESKPGAGQRSIYTSVRTWIDTRRLVPLRIVKTSRSGPPVRRIDITHIVTDDLGRAVPANFFVSGSNESSGTEIEGAKLTHQVNLSDSELTPNGLKEVTVPRR